MTSQLIQTLLEPPSTKSSEQKALLLLNSRFRSLQDLNDLDFTTKQSLTLRDDLDSKVRREHLTRIAAQNSPDCRSSALKFTGANQCPTLPHTSFCDGASTDRTGVIITSALTIRRAVISMQGARIIDIKR
jgi:hypothetical protein